MERIDIQKLIFWKNSTDRKPLGLASIPPRSSSQHFHRVLYNSDFLTAIFSFPFLFEENHCCDLFFIPIFLSPHIKLQKYKNFVVRNSFAKITQRRYANSTPITYFLQNTIF
mgnify:CR=1 FL=1